MGGVEDGLLVIDKPTGPTSFDIVARVRRDLRVKKAGHCGTLDPAAGGVLLVVVGRATRLAEYTAKYKKTYEAVVRLGVSTDTDDGEGEIISENEVPTLSVEDIEAVLTVFTGEIEQRIPAYSAVKISGERLYKKARRGEEIKTPLRKVTVYDIKLVGFNPPELTINVVCAGGTYVRALARDIGEKLGCGAHLSRLTRTSVGPYRLDVACPPETVSELNGNEGCFIPFDEMLPETPFLDLDYDSASAITYGRYLQVSEGIAPGIVKLYFGSALIALASFDGKDIKPEKVFVDAGQLKR